MSIVDIVNGMGPDTEVRVTELGKIKIGGLGESRPTQSGGTFRIPRKDDHFTITTLQRTQAKDLIADKPLMEQLLAEYGDEDGKLRQIPVRVLSNDVDDVLQSAFVWYGGKVVGARSDGKTVTWNCDPHNGKRLAQPKEEPWTPAMLELRDSRGNKLFKLHSVFNCVIAAKQSRFGGVYKFRTTSVISFKQLYGSLLHVHQLTGGVLMGMPLMLVVRPMQVAPDGKATTVYVVHVELRGEGLAQLQAQAVEQMRFMLENRQKVIQTTEQYRRLLLPPGHETASDAADIQEEFAPEATAPEPAPDYVEILDGKPDAPKVDPETVDIPAIDPVPDAPTIDPEVAASDAHQALEEQARLFADGLDAKGCDKFLRSLPQSELTAAKEYCGHAKDFKLGGSPVEILRPVVYAAKLSQLEQAAKR